jgi:hypothetical protein
MKVDFLEVEFLEVDVLEVDILEDGIATYHRSLKFDYSDSHYSDAISHMCMTCTYICT